MYPVQNYSMSAHIKPLQASGLPRPIPSKLPINSVNVVSLPPAAVGNYWMHTSHIFIQDYRKLILIAREAEICLIPRVLQQAYLKTPSLKDYQSLTLVAKPQHLSLQLEKGKAYHNTFREGNDLPAC